MALFSAKQSGFCKNPVQTLSCVGWGLSSEGERPGSCMLGDIMQTSSCWFSAALWAKPDAPKWLKNVQQLLWLEHCDLMHSSASGCTWALCIVLSIAVAKASSPTWKAGLQIRLPLAFCVGVLFSSIRTGLCISWGMKFSWVISLSSSPRLVGTKGSFQRHVCLG